MRSIRLAIGVAAFILAGGASAQPRAIDTEKSVMTVHVHKAGVFSALGHDHEISASIARGTMDAAAQLVKLYVKAGALQVRDAGASEKDRAQIQSTMLGPEVLDAEKFPEIAFVSTGAEGTGANSWTVHGNLTLHGQTHAVDVDVRETSGHYTGTSHFKQTDFGIKPVRVAGGSIRVKDEIQIEFAIQLAR